MRTIHIGRELPSMQVGVEALREKGSEGPGVSVEVEHQSQGRAEEEMQ